MEGWTPPNNASAATLRTYEKEFRRLINKYKTRTPEQLWAAICATRSKRTYYLRLAALKCNLPTVLRRLHETAKASHVAIVEFCIGVGELVNQAAGTCPIPNPKQRHSKRKDIGGLPANWRELLSAEMEKTAYGLPFLTMAVSGCRPEELRKGIKLTATKDRLVINVDGAKVKESQGQPTRQIVYRVDSSSAKLVVALHEKLWGKAPEGAGFREIEVAIQNKAGFTSSIRRAGRRLWPRRSSEITPYCLRHAAAADWKSRLCEDDVSLALGHLSAETKRFYGQAQMAKGGGLNPESVAAPRALSKSAKPRPWNGFKVVPR